MQQNEMHDSAEFEEVYTQLKRLQAELEKNKAEESNHAAPADAPAVAESVEDTEDMVEDAEVAEDEQTLAAFDSAFFEEEAGEILEPVNEVPEDAPAQEPVPVSGIAKADAATPEEIEKEEVKRPPLKELPYAQKGNVFAPFGFAVPEKKQEPGEIAADDGAADKKAAPPAAPAAPEKPRRESRVFAPFGLAGVPAAEPAKVSAAKEKERSTSAAEPAVPSKETVAAKEAAPVPQKDVPIAPNAADPAPQKEPLPRTKEETVQAPAKKAAPAPTVPKTAEGDPLEGLLTDIFGERRAGSRGWFDQAPSQGKRRPAASARAQKPADGDSGTVAVPRVVKAAPAPETKKSRVEPVAEDGAKNEERDGLMLQFYGQTVEMPHDSEYSSVLMAKKRALAMMNGEDADFSALSVERPDAARAARQHTGETKARAGGDDYSEDELQLLLDLDYENELGAVIGYEPIKEHRERHLNGHCIGREKKKGKKHFGYGSHAQDIAIGKQYVRERRRRIVDLTVSLLLLIVLFIYERPQFMDRWFGTVAAANRYPFLYALCGLLLLSVGVFLLRHRLVSGFVQMLRLSPTDHSLCSVAVFITYIYHIALLFAPRDRELALYLSPAACNMMLLSLANLLDGYREAATFRVISSKQQKYALLPRMSVGNRENDPKLHLGDSERKVPTWYVRPVDFIRNYYTNTEKKIGHNRSFGAILLLVIAISMTCGLFVFAMGASLRETAHAMFVTLMFCLPAMSVLITALPLFLAGPLRLGRQGAIVGEETVYKAVDAAKIVLPESEVFAPMEHEKFDLAVAGEGTEVKALIRALLEKLDSPMAASVTVNAADRISPSLITLTEIDEYGVAAVTADEGQSTLLFGSAEYLAKHGVTVTLREDEEDYEALRRRLLGVAINGRPVARFFARYRMNSDITKMLSDLSDEDVQLTVRTKDPGIHEDLFARLVAEGGISVEVQKPLVDELDIRTDRVDATVVGIGSYREAAKTYVTCRRIRRAGRFGKGLQIASVVCGVLLTGALAFFGKIVTVPAYAVTLYMLFWCLWHTFSSYLYLRK